MMTKHVGFILIFCFIGVFPVAHAAEEKPTEAGTILAEADEMWPEVDYTTAAEPEEEVLDFARTKLTGDWGGVRTDLANKGITFDIDILQSWQGVLSGGRDKSWKYGGSLDYWLNFDFEKMGLWEGAFVEMRAETQYGRFANLHLRARTRNQTGFLRRRTISIWSYALTGLCLKPSRAVGVHRPSNVWIEKPSSQGKSVQDIECTVYRCSKSKPWTWQL